VKSSFEFYFQNLEDLLKKEGKNGASSELLNSLLLERITLKIYEKIFPKSETLKDQEFHDRLKTLQWITFQNLSINFKWNKAEEIWKLSIEGIFLK